MWRRIFSVWDSVGRKSLKHSNNEKHKQTCKLQTFTSAVESWNKRQIMKRNSNSAHPSESKTKQMSGCLHAFSILAAWFINWLCCDYLYHMCCWIDEDHFLEITYVQSICMCFFLYSSNSSFWFRHWGKMTQCVNIPFSILKRKRCERSRRGLDPG